MDATVKDLQIISDGLKDIQNKLDKHLAVSEVNNKHIMEMLQRHDRVLFGDNGKSVGLNVRVNRIETSAKVISKITWSGLIAGLGALGTFISCREEVQPVYLYQEHCYFI